MKASLILAVATLVVCSATASAIATNTKDFSAMFETFKADFKRSYATEEENDVRRNVFIANMLVAEGLAASNPLANFGPNEFSDMSAAEFSVYHNAARHFRRHNATNMLAAEQIPALSAGSKIDWRTKGAVTRVKNQGHCGSCYSFSISGNIEGQWFLAGNTLTSLSEQELVSCGTAPIQPGGCHGALPDEGFEWLVSNHGGAVVTEASYPYVSGNGTVPMCRMSGTQFGARITGHHDIPPTEDAIAAWLYTHGPVSIGVDSASFQTYTGGIMTNCIDGQLDHAVLVVGFDDTYSPPYWIVKNSWGPTWGEEGYIRLQKGTGQCGMNTAPSTSVISKSGPQPPNPPAPSVPVPVPSTPTSGSYTYYNCEDNQCSNCKQYTFNADECIDEEGVDMSFTARCKRDGNEAVFDLYENNSKCTGVGESQTIKNGVCYSSPSTSTYLKIVCPQ